MPTQAAPETLLTQAIALYQANQLDQAIASLHRAVHLNPNDFASRLLLGLILQKLARFPDSIPHLQAALQLQSASAEAAHALAVAQLATQDFAAATQTLTDSANHDPASLSLHLAIAREHHRDQRWAAALDSLKIAHQLNPRDALLCLMIAQIADRVGQSGDARTFAQRALDAGLVTEESRFVATAFVGGYLPQAPPALIAKTFDDYSQTFEDDLLGSLNYQGHILIDRAVRAVGTKPPTIILDAGCGTGLCAMLLRPLATTLIGVDLSPQMIDRARQADLYDHLIVGDLTQTLRAHAGAIDVIVAGDVIVYIGECHDLFDAVATALRPSGIFAFTIETNPQDGIRLNPSRRYAHSLSYIRQLAAARHLKELYCQPATTRYERGNPVPSHVIVIGKR